MYRYPKPKVITYFEKRNCKVTSNGDSIDVSVKVDMVHFYANMVDDVWNLLFGYNEINSEGRVTLSIWGW